MGLKKQVVPIFRGFGQIMLQESAITGLFFFVGVAFDSFVMLSGLLLGGVTGIASAKFFKFNPSDIMAGNYGFNGALVGIGIFFFHSAELYSTILILIGATLSTCIMRLMLRCTRLPPYTAPFILATWLMLFIADMLGLKSGVTSTTSALNTDFLALTRGVGQVMFQSHWLAGLIFIIGIALNSLSAAAWGIIGSAAGIIIGRCLSFPDDIIANGLYGFNAVLTAIALSIWFPKDALPPLIGIFLSVLITRLFELIGLPSLTAPFVLSTWMIIIIVGYLKSTRSF